MVNQNTRTVDLLLAKLTKERERPDTLPTAIYVRKSTKDESQVSLKGQIESCNKVIENDARLHLVKTYEEDNKSGYHIEGRKEMKALIEECKKGNIKVIIAYSLDRISRNVYEGIGLETQLEAYGVKIIYSSQAFENNADGRFTKNILRALAQRLPESTAETTFRSELENAKLCKFNGGHIPYGYSLVDGKLVINDVEADVVRTMFDDAFSGMSIPEIATDIALKGFTPRSGQPKFAVNSI